MELVDGAGDTLGYANIVGSSETEGLCDVLGLALIVGAELMLGR